MLCSLRNVAAVVLVVSSCIGCGGALLPRTSSPLPWTEWAESGAMVDASRGHPVAFWADPSRIPATVEVMGATLYSSQWLTHLALRMNEAVGRKTLFDSRFQSVSPQLFKWALSAGRYHYTYRAKPSVTAELIARTHARAVELRLRSALAVKLGSERGVRVLIDVVIGGIKRSYSADSTRTSGWDVDVMDQLARKILGDASFWAAARSS